MTSIQDLIGTTEDLSCEESTVIVNNLTVTCWKYFNNTESKRIGRSVVAIHGGPACCHDYCLPLQLLARHGYDVIFYDQAGCGKSSFVDDPEKDAPWLLTITYYLEELEAVLKHFTLAEYYLYGSSWGTIVCQEYAIRRPVGLKGMVLDGALSDAKLYIETQWRDRISKLPSYTQQIMKNLIESKDFENPSFTEINNIMSRHFTCRVLPRPVVYDEIIKKMNPKIYSLMQGDCEFMIGGVLKEWTITAKLNQVACPTQVLVGEFDTMTEECSMAIVNNIPLCRPLIIVPRAAHMKLLDEPIVCIQHITAFLNSL